MRLRGIELLGAYKVNFEDEWLEIYNEKGNMIYCVNDEGDWSKWAYDEQGNQIYYENIRGHWAKWEYDSNGNTTYYGNSSGYWSKWAYDEEDVIVYYETNNGLVFDNRVKELTIRELEDLLGYKIKVKGE